MKLEFEAPYDWPLTLAFFAKRAIEGVEWIADDTYWRAYELSGRQGVFAVRPRGANTLELTATDEAVVPIVRRMFDLDANPSDINRLLGSLSEDRPGLRVPQGWNTFEVTMRAIFGQQVTVKAGVRMVSQLAAISGARLNVLGAPSALTHVFPRPEQITEEVMAKIRGPKARVSTVLDVVKLALQNEAFRAEDLRGIKGIGDWTIGYVGMRGCSDRDAFPARDVVLLRALARRTGTATPAKLLEFAEQWRPYRAYAALHLWAGEA